MYFSLNEKADTDVIIFENLKKDKIEKYSKK